MSSAWIPELPVWSLDEPLAADLARGADPDLAVHRGYQVGVRVCVPPFPFDDEDAFDENSRNAAVVFEDPDDREGIHVEDTKNVEGQWRVAGTSGIVLVATGNGATMREAQRAAYDRLDDVVIPNVYYRDDIGDRWVEADGDKLQAWGYLGGG